MSAVNNALRHPVGCSFFLVLFTTYII